MLTYRVREKQKGVNQVEDAKIIALLFARREQAVKEIDLAYGRRLFLLSDRIVSNPEDAQECVSDTYQETWKTIPPKRPVKLYAYLAALCRNISLNRLDWNRAAKRNAEIVSLTQEMETCIPDTLQEKQLERRELKRTLEHFLDSLPAESRLIFLRRYLYVDTVAEIAERYGISESKVKTQLHRTRKKLSAYLAKEGIPV